MSFELAAIVVVAVLATVLGLVVYHLLGRLERLERSVQGGLVPPSTRLSREQFERRFRIAHARSRLAAERGTGVVLVVGAEHHDDGDVARTVANLARTDQVTVVPVTDVDADALGIATTPYLFVIDDHVVRAAQPVASSTDLIRVLAEYT